ncbi:MAG: flavodoxin-dependent (E)-4-hydroxy-3-methylbut-2-enyl-diphosphate synthase [Clostridia bacterium]|nr:flavodoxin-dependent (E)-4-hydroxy-3-methylbut-2-enyl-diphosphate synthase [Clostridia bacterium]
MVRDLPIGGGAPVSVQTMANADPRNYPDCLAQLRAFEEAGADLARFTVPDRESAAVLAKLREVSRIPLVADIHFDYRLAVLCAESGVDKIRINPGNIGDADRVKAVADACRKAGVPIRIGVNSGSLRKDLLAKYGSPTAEALVESAVTQAEMLERFDFRDIVISIKASSAPEMIRACRMMHEKTDYPLHLGVTEAGGGDAALVKGAVGIGTLLAEGIGDTVRVSLSEDPVKEVAAGLLILKALGLRGGVDVVSCPTCGRTEVDVMEVSRALSARYAKVALPPEKSVKAAVMGCVVNGPGEAREADVGIAGGKNEWLLFRNGEIREKLSPEEALPRMIREIDSLLASRGATPPEE